MNRFLGLLLIFTIIVSCKKTSEDRVAKKVSEWQEIKKDTYELSKPSESIKGVLILFGGFPEKIEDIKREFQILELAKTNSIAVLFMNFNRKLWLSEGQKTALATQLQSIFIENQLPKHNVYVGGFSSGGNMALLISDFMIQQDSEIKPKGVFAVDSPIDLVALYKSSEKNIERNFSEASVLESNWIIKTLGEKLGNPHKDLSKYHEYAVYNSETETIDNLMNLKNIKIRLYTEPDTVWWKEHRMADFDQMNAYYLQKLSVTLQDSGFQYVEYIPTKNKGYRANGDRHPHSWRIVEKEDLINWMTE